MQSDRLSSQSSLVPFEEKRKIPGTVPVRPRRVFCSRRDCVCAGRRRSLAEWSHWEYLPIQQPKEEETERQKQRRRKSLTFCQAWSCYCRLCFLLAPISVLHLRLDSLNHRSQISTSAQLRHSVQFKSSLDVISRDKQTAVVCRKATKSEIDQSG